MDFFLLLISVLLSKKFMLSVTFRSQLVFTDAGLAISYISANCEPSLLLGVDTTFDFLNLTIHIYQSNYFIVSSTIMTCDI